MALIRRGATVPGARAPHARRTLTAGRAATAWCAVVVAFALLASASAAAQIAGLAGEYTETDIEIEVTNGTTMYALVREFYPSRMNRWLLVAADIAAANPQAFRNGDPANMIVGESLTLIDYGDGIDNLPEDAPAQTDAPEGRDDDDAPQAATPPDSAAPAAAVGTLSGGEPVAAAPPAADDAPAADARPSPAARIGRIDRLGGTPVVIGIDGAQRALAANDAVHTGELLVAGDDGQIVLAMIDKAVVEVTAGGRMLFERYAFDETAPGSVSTITLLDGGMRIKTGLIGSRRPDAVSVNTPVATITVEGTRFALNLCGDETCRVSGRDRALSSGLYAGVVEGSISIANNTGDTTVGRGDVVRVRDADALVESAPEARTLVFTDAELAALSIEVDRPLSFWEWFKQRFFGIG